MIKGLYEAHLPVSNLDDSIEFYKKLGLKLYKRYEKVTFFWIEKGKSWIGLWEGSESKLPYHVSLRHIAFYVELEDIKRAKVWLKERGIEVRDEFHKGTEEPVVVPSQAHAMIYFDDPDGNHLEFITRLPKEMNELEKMYLSRWEELYEYNTLDIERVEEALLNSWSLESSSKWSKDNPAMGQCGVSTLVVSDIIGGEIRKTKLPNGWHFYNFINGKRYDFTVSQFREEDIVYSDIPTNRAEAYMDTNEKQYKYLKQKVLQHLGTNSKLTEQQSCKK